MCCGDNVEGTLPVGDVERSGVRHSVWLLFAGEALSTGLSDRGFGVTSLGCDTGDEVEFIVFVFPPNGDDALSCFLAGDGDCGVESNSIERYLYVDVPSTELTVPLTDVTVSMGANWCRWGVMKCQDSAEFDFAGEAEASSSCFLACFNATLSSE